MLNLINNQGIQIETVMRYCNRMLPGGRPQLGICNGVQKSLEIIGSTPQSYTCLECRQLWSIVGGARNGAAEEDWRWDLNSGKAAIWCLFWDHESFRGPCSTGRRFGDHAALEGLHYCHVDGAGSLNHGLPLLT